MDSLSLSTPSDNLFLHSVQLWGPKVYMKTLLKRKFAHGPLLIRVPVLCGFTIQLSKVFFLIHVHIKLVDLLRGPSESADHSGAHCGSRLGRNCARVYKSRRTRARSLEWLWSLTKVLFFLFFSPSFPRVSACGCVCVNETWCLVWERD